MKTISYIPSKDEMLLRFGPLKGKPTKDLGQFKLWWDEEGHICALDIIPYRKELIEFKKRRGWIELGGIWKGIKITEEDIKEARQELLKKIEEKWEKW